MKDLQPQVVKKIINFPETKIKKKGGRMTKHRHLLCPKS